MNRYSNEILVQLTAQNVGTVHLHDWPALMINMWTSINRDRIRAVVWSAQQNIELAICVLDNFCQLRLKNQ